RGRPDAAARALLLREQLRAVAALEPGVRPRRDDGAAARHRVRVRAAPRHRRSHRGGAQGMSAASEPGGFVRWRTTHGTLRGIRSGGVAWHLGVPDGGDTGGRNRSGPPPPLEPWSGDRDATRFGPAAPQLDTRIGARANTPAVLSLLYPRGGSPLEGGPYGEDCLRLDVWAPADAGPGSLPVVVWLHGGAFVHGSGNEQV